MSNGKNWEETNLLPIEEQKRTLRQQRCKFWSALILSNLLAALIVYTLVAPGEAPSEIFIRHPAYQKISLPLEVLVPLDPRPEIPITILDEQQRVIVALAYLWPNQRCPATTPTYYTVEILPEDVAQIVRHRNGILQAYPYLANAPTPPTSPQPRNHYEIKI
jgi:hypothetical protein